MLTPAQLMTLPEPLLELFGELEAEILADICARIVKHGTVTASSVWQIEKLKEMRGLNRNATRLISKALNASDAEVGNILRDAGVKALAVDEAVYRAAGLATGKFVYSEALNEVLKAGIAKTNGLLHNYCGTTALDATKALANALDKSYLGITTGNLDPATAIRRSVKEIAGKGIQSVAYPSGHVDSLETSVRRALLTGANQTTAELQLARADELGSDLVEVTAHSGARPEHAEWQGQIYSRSGKVKGYKDFYSSTGYGDGDGLCGWNCYHNFYPYILGFSTPTFSKQRSSDNDAEYDIQQEQRALERAIRASKKEVMALDAARKAATTPETRAQLDEEFSRAARTLANRWKRLESFLDSHDGFFSASDRTAVGGYDRSIAGKAAWAARKAT